MSIRVYILAASVVISFIIILTVSFKSKNFFKSVFLSAFSGIGALFAVNVLSRFTPLFLPVNLFTAGVSALGGIPGVIALLLTTFTV